MKFEKWQALGNDYVILAESDLWLSLTPGRVRRICAGHTGVGSDGVVLISAATDTTNVARLSIFNPDGSEAELSGNGARQAVMYLRRRGFVDSDSFSVETAAGEIHPEVTGPSTCKVEMGRARLTSPGFPTGGSDGRGTVVAAGRSFSFQHVNVGNPQCAIELAHELADFDLRAYGPAIERSDLFPNRTNVSFWRRDADSQITARIFERGVGETLSSGTGASGAAVAAVLAGAKSPVTVHLDGGDLEVDVTDDLDVRLGGWAVCVYQATFSEEFMKELDATE